jgi:hypothetical protein
MIDPTIPCPASGTGQLDSVIYRSVHFYGAVLSKPLAEAAGYIEQLERMPVPPHFLGVRNQFSAQDEGSPIAWCVTVLFSEPLDTAP